MEVKLFAYRHGNTIMHRILASIKIVFLMLFCIFTFWGSNYSTAKEIISVQVIFQTSLTLVISLVMFFLSGAKLKTLNSISFVLLLGIFVILFRTISFESSQTNTIYVYKYFGLNIDGFACGVLYTIRFFITALAAQIIFETTSSLEIQNSIEEIENTFAKLFPKIKKLRLALIISLAINFIPMIFEVWNRVHLASIARCASNNKNIVVKVQNIFKELESLFSCLLYKAEIKRQALLNRSFDLEK